MKKIKVKCDNCDWFTNDVNIIEITDWINKLCPKCNENLLTEEDYKDFIIFLDYCFDNKIKIIDIEEINKENFIINVHNKEIKCNKI